jgi:hypothetical protein
MVEAGTRTALQYDWPIVTRRILSYYERLQSQIAEGTLAPTPARRRWTRSARA